ncbi:MAG: hypothetical protein C5S41_04720 [Candidatus Methanomarinus sp.]|nr:MAG: hypothetical protein C5S41_04720 [ANME-2 cluster archaeon]
MPGKKLGFLDRTADNNWCASGGGSSVFCSRYIDAERPITSPFFENEWFEGPFELKNIEDENISISNAKALKVVTENPFDEGHYLIYVQSPDWNNELWNTVLSQHGEFVLIDEKDWLLRGDAKLRANPDKFQLIKKDNVTVYALDILPSYAFDSAIFASFMSENIRQEFGLNIGNVDVLVCHSSGNEYYSLIEQRDYSWKLLVGKLSAYNDISEDASAMENVINAIYESEETLSNDDIKNMLKIHFDSTEVDTLFGQYSQAKNVTDSYSTYRRVSAKNE